MTFRASDATLVRLEWPRLLELLAAQAATERGADALRALDFPATHAGARERLDETSEARRLLDAASDPPFGGIVDLRVTEVELARGRALAARELAQLAQTLEAARRVRGALREKRELAPGLVALAETLPDLRALESAIGAVVTAAGEIRDDASPELRRARRRVRELEGEIERQMARHLRDADVQAHLQDSYATFRENRPVLPIRAEARQRVRGIVHDVSSSGTTVFIEPEDVVEAGNRLRIAQTELTREIERLLTELSGRAREHTPELEAQGATLERLDCAFARGRLSRRASARAPRIAPDCALELRGLRHPLLLLEAGLAPEDVVPNDLVLADGARCLVISGPNAGGKTVAAKAVGLAVLSLRAGLHVACDEGSSLGLFDAVFAEIGDEQDLRAGLSTFSARMANLAEVVAQADAQSLVIADEVGEGTEPGEGAALAQAILEALVARGARVLATTHFNRLKELAGDDPRFANASAEFDPETLLPTFRIHLGQPGSSGAMWVAQRMGLDESVVERARELMDREDSRLEALTRGLSELRQELEAERRLALRMREESEVARSAYETRLTALRGAREQALAAMKSDLEAAFARARAEIAHVVRALQRGDAAAGPAANRAQAELARIRERTAAVEERQREPEVTPAAAPAAVDDSRLVAGARVELAGVRSPALVLEPPDKRGRLAVRVGAARTVVARSRVTRVLSGEPAKPKPSSAHVTLRRELAEEPSSLRCDLRGLRVDEALERADSALQRLLGRGGGQVIFIHGHGTGALRDAIRSWLRSVRGVEKFEPGGPREGGNGVTVATLAD
ncbi:MAG TPA: Smr/MutS family protein [Myxococcota bacterium]|nr:Smr/MutS family protein [Myxococcota bacterium]